MLPEAPLVSVLMPVYNGEKYLRPAIDSILSQAFRDFELLIVNDGSTDSSEAIILSYTDGRIRYIRNEQNLRLIATLNKGLGLCKGKYIARMDCDDVSYPERLAKQVSFMEANPVVGICGTQIDLDPPAQSWVPAGTHEFIRFNFLFHNPVCHPSVLLRVAVLREHGLRYPENLHAEEYALWLRMMAHCECHVLPDVLLYYRLHEGQVSQVFKKKQVETVNGLRLGLLREIVFFSTPGMRRAHLVIADVMAQQLPRVPVEQIVLNLGGWVTLTQLRTWLFAFRFSLMFRKKWDSPYLRMLIGKVAAEVKRKKNAVPLKPVKP